MVNQLIINHLGEYLAQCKEGDEVCLKDFLKENNYPLDLSNIRINFSKLPVLRRIDCSEITLKNCKLHNLPSDEVSFASSDLTNSNITFKENQKCKIDFADSNLTRSFIWVQKIDQANFDNTIMHDTMIMGGGVDKTNLDKVQQLETIDLVVTNDSYFTQNNLTDKYAVLKQSGVCQGLCIELARHMLMSRAKGEEDDTYLEKLHNKIKNPSMHFTYRIQSYHDKLQAVEHRVCMNIEDISNDEFFQALPKKVKKSDILGCIVSVGDDAHTFTVIRLRDKKNHIVGYKIFDPNVGDVFCQNEQEINQQVNLLYQFYQTETTNQFSFFEVIALDQLVKEYGLIHPKDVQFTVEEKIQNKAKKYAMMSDEDKFHMIIESHKSNASEIAAAKKNINNMNIEEINTPIQLGDGSNTYLLIMAAKSGKAELSSLLIAKGAKLDVQDKDGLTPLHYAIINRNEETRKALLVAGASLYIKNSQGKTPLDLEKEIIQGECSVHLKNNNVKKYDTQFRLVQKISSLLEKKKHLPKSHAQNEIEKSQQTSELGAIKRH